MAPSFSRGHIAIIAIIVVAVAGLEFANGRPVICPCGYVKLWANSVNSAENSQMVADWYSLSHVVHGLIFFGVLTLFARRLALGARLAIINSVSDICCMMLGFLIASRLPWWGTLALGIALELIALAVIRDNLALNVIMLLYPIDAIRQWQNG